MKMDHKKSYELRVYESVDERSISKVIFLKQTKKELDNKGLNKRLPGKGELNYFLEV